MNPGDWIRTKSGRWTNPLKKTSVTGKVSENPKYEEEYVEPLEWLEQPTSERALEWVNKQNEKCFSQPSFGSPEKLPTYEKLLSVLNNKEKIPHLSKLGDFYYNFWQDEDHVRGIWRRTSLEEYRKPAPEWEMVLDLDKLNETESASWVWKGFTKCVEEGTFTGLCLIKLSPGGGDAVVLREFDVFNKSFLSIDDPKSPGFFVAEAKSNAVYKSRDVLLIGTDFGEGSMTSSGYARIVKEWRRGTPLAEAKTVVEGEHTDMVVSGGVDRTHGHVYEIHSRQLTFYTEKYEVKIGESAGDFKELQLQDDAFLSTFGKYFVIALRSAWESNGKSYPAGSLLCVNAQEFVSGNTSSLTSLFEPTERSSFKSVNEAAMTTKNMLIVRILDNIKTRFKFFRYTDEGLELDEGLTKSFISDSDSDVIDISPVDKHHSDCIWVSRQGPITPSSLYVCDLADLESVRSPELLKSLPALFNADGMTVDQHHAVSKDGTSIPYFQVSKAQSAPSPRPTVLYGYGGFQISLLPNYSAMPGAAWLARGGVWVVANIRGGGEFGPKWHQAALKENRHLAYEDFEAVAEDLIARGVTTSPQLACMGGSNGGLLVGNMLVRRPKLWGAIVCAVPLLDMRRYNRLLAGASWMAEYGDPDVPEQWEYIQTFSPYHLLRDNVEYPPVLFTTSTKDDRVCPSHARKMVHKMNDMGLGDKVFYYENTEGGHGGAADNKQAAFGWTLRYEFLANKLGLE